MTYIRTTGRHIRKRWRAEARPECSSTKELFEREMERTVKYMTTLDTSRTPDAIAKKWRKYTECQLKKLAKKPDTKWGKGTFERILLMQARHMFGLSVFNRQDIEWGSGTLTESLGHQRVCRGEFLSYARKDSSDGMADIDELCSDGGADPDEGLAVGEPEIVWPEETD